MGRDAYGDFQTPPDLAAAVCKVVRQGTARRPASIIEPTCGRGSLLLAAMAAFPTAAAAGADISAKHLAAVRRDRTHRRAGRLTLHREDVFAGAWRARLAAAAEPILVIGNPPWVTTRDLGALGSTNRPARGRSALRGLDAVTGRSNFDVSEWLVSELVRELAGRDATIAMLVKTAVARRVLATAWRAGLAVRARLYAIDALAHFGAAVDACLLVVAPGEMGEMGEMGSDPISCAVFPTLEARAPASTMALRDGQLVADVAAYEAMRHRRAGAATDAPPWRSGIKHDCAAVMEVARDAALECAYPLLKGGDLARGNLTPTRALLVTQRTTGEDTAALARRAPRTWRYLARHRAQLARRASSIYRGRPPYSIFGVGPYTFAPWKVAVAGIAKALAFRVIGPDRGQPVVFDDTCYFLPFETERAARAAARQLEAARPLFESMIFWDAKRPITGELLRSVALRPERRQRRPQALRRLA